MTLVTLAVRNVRRNQLRAVMTIAGCAVAILAFVALRTVISAWNVAVEFAAKDRIGTRHKVSFVLQLPKHYIDTVRAIPGVKAATWCNWFGGKNPKNRDDFFATLACDPDSVLEVLDEVEVPPAQKAAWREDRKGAILGDLLAKKMNVKPGDRVTLSGTIYPGDWSFNVSGIYTAKRKSVDRQQFFFHWSYLNETLGKGRKDQIGWVISRIDDPSKVASISTAIDRAFDEKDVPTLSMSERAMNLSFMGMLSAVLTAIDVVSLIILAIMMMILGNTIAMGVRERTHEYGALMARGFQPRHIGLFVLMESVVTAIVGGLIGLGLAYPLIQQGLGRFLEENMGAFFPYFRISPATAVAAVGLSALLGVLAAVIPVSIAMRLNVTDALRRVG
jgi:putative ABC transport system permease protein